MGLAIAEPGRNGGGRSAAARTLVAVVAVVAAAAASAAVRSGLSVGAPAEAAPEVEAEVQSPVARILPAIAGSPATPRSLRRPGCGAVAGGAA